LFATQLDPASANTSFRPEKRSKTPESTSDQNGRWAKNEASMTNIAGVAGNMPWSGEADRKFKLRFRKVLS